MSRVSDVNHYCKNESDASYECLRKNNYDREACAACFENYKRCKKVLNNIQKERRHKGLPPNPPIGEK